MERPDRCNSLEEEWIDPNDESFLNGIVHEFEQLEKNNYNCQVSTVTTSTCDQHTSVKSTKANSTSRIQTQSGATPSRSHVLTHISPVTLLPSAQSNTAHCTRGNSSSNQLHTVAISTKSSCPTATNVHSPSTPASDLMQHKQASPSNTLSWSTNKSHTHDTRSVATETVSSTPSTSTDFLTPSTSQWMKVKSSRSTCTSPSLLSYDSPQPFNGGKITPPLCNCGKRAKRKLVTSPGPNQGKPFFSCSGARESGCQYFKWENTSPLGERQITNSIVNLTSEYD